MKNEEIKPKAEEIENKKRKEFFTKIATLSKEYGYDIACKLEISESGISPMPVIVKIKENEK